MFAVIAISEGPRRENDIIRVTVISPGVTESEAADSVSRRHSGTMKAFRRGAIPQEAIAPAIAFVIEQPARRRKRNHRSFDRKPVLGYL
jgi:NADP-dependent 3-hydroxy acid dehydrogenase YdfG